MDPEGAARALRAERERVVRALHYLDEERLIELRASEPRLRFSRTDGADSLADLGQTTVQLFVAALLRKRRYRPA